MSIQRFKMEFQPEGIVREVVFADDYDRELSALREELANEKARIPQYIAERAQTEQRLTAAEQRNAELVKACEWALRDSVADDLDPWFENMKKILEKTPNVSAWTNARCINTQHDFDSVVLPHPNGTLNWCCDCEKVWISQPTESGASE